MVPKAAIWLLYCQAELFISICEKHQKCSEQMLFARDKRKPEK